MKLTTEQIKQMIVEELRSLMEQEKSYEQLLDELVAEIKQYNAAFIRLSPLFGDLWKVLMKKHVQSAVPNMMSYVIEKVIGNWSDLAKKPGDPEWNAEEAVGELELYLENAVDALEEFKSANPSHYNFMDDFSSAFRKEYFGGFGFRAIFGKLILDVNNRLPEKLHVKDIPVTLYMDGWRKHLPDLVPEYYDFMRAIVEVVPEVIAILKGEVSGEDEESEESEESKKPKLTMEEAIESANLLLSGNPEFVAQGIELIRILMDENP